MEYEAVFFFDRVPGFLMECTADLNHLMKYSCRE